MTPSKPRFHRQETTYSCVPACLRIALSSFGVEITEERLRELCDCTPVFGTDALQAINAAHQLGFTGTAKHTLSFDELRALVEEDDYFFTRFNAGGDLVRLPDSNQALLFRPTALWLPKSD